MAQKGRPADYRTPVSLPEANRLAAQLWGALGVEAAPPAIKKGRPSYRCLGRWYTREHGTREWIALMPPKPLPPGKAYVKNTPWAEELATIFTTQGGFQVATVLHELAHALHFNRCGRSIARQRFERFHGPQWSRCLREIERAYDALAQKGSN